MLGTVRKMYDDPPLESREIRDLDGWSTPERRRKDCDLDLIPNEIYLRILTGVEDKKDLQNIALVCRFFASVALPKLLGDISMDTFYEPSQKIFREIISPKLYSALREGSDPLVISACRYIRSFEWYNCVAPLSPSTIISYLDDMQKMPNLTTLTLERLILSKGALGRIAQLSKLTSLGLHSCHPSDDLTDSDVLELADALQLNSLSFLYPSHPPVTAFDPLFVNSRVTEFHAESPDFIRCLGAQSIVSTLQVLDLSFVHDLGRVYESLCRIPTLIELKLDFISWPKEVPDPAEDDRPEIHLTFPLSALPNLRRLSCSARLVYLLSGPHLLEVVTFHEDFVIDPRRGEPLPTRFLELSSDARLFFDGPNRNLRRLECLPSGMMKGGIGEGWHGKLQDWFPKLKALHFIILVYSPGEYTPLISDDGDDSDPYVLDNIEENEGSFENLLQSFVDGWGPFTTLTELIIDVVGNGDHKEKTVRKTWIEDFASTLNLRSHFPNLTYMSFGNVRSI
ncbi:hypothetical protein GYMLUDRAFT_97632 [Collybiopsis luxurians FD-317 M1]|uniref:F-box domain-containing protein n=1 Tax=Collybiopsis luxurians FD-317 M1 TaxID=944289 RepID=A0A0D0CAF5_9AGAR|nr:hypothetical protein GYMLUDRAFT_97632 [Collybiopsis luxurians FD-317 M1]